MTSETQFKIMVKGQQINVAMNVNERRTGGAYATFSTTIDDRFISDDTLEALTKKIGAALRTKQAKLDIPFSLFAMSHKGGQVLNGKITGQHAGSGKMLVRYSDGSASQVEPYATFMHRLTADEAALLVKMNDDMLALRKQIEQFTGEHKFDARAAVRDAIGADDD